MARRFFLRSLSRGRFPRRARSLWYLGLAGLLTLCLAGCRGGGTPGKTELEPVSRRVYLMGTVCTLTLFSADRPSGLQQLQRLIEILEDTEAQLSTWREDSALSRFNRHPLGEPFLLESSLCRLFARLLYWSRQTEGTFDPALGRLLEAWDVRGEGRLPSPTLLEAARRASGMEHVEFQADLCRIIRRREVRLDAGAFGKGEALDRTLAYSREHDLNPWRIDLGGQIMVHRLPPGDPQGKGWPVWLASPLDRERPLLFLRLSSGSVATSGGSERDVGSSDRPIGHILDPRSGQPATFAGSVSVWHPEGLTADILSTALFVMGIREGTAWAEARQIAACFLVSRPEGEVEILTTSEWKRRFGY